MKMEINNIVDRLGNCADALNHLNARLRIANAALFGHHRVTDVPREPPTDEINNPASVPPTVEFNFQDALEHQFTRLEYYAKYADEMFNSIEEFAGKNSPAQSPGQRLGGSLPMTRPRTNDEMEELLKEMKNQNKTLYPDKASMLTRERDSKY